MIEVFHIHSSSDHDLGGVAGIHFSSFGIIISLNNEVLEFGRGINVLHSVCSGAQRDFGKIFSPVAFCDCTCCSRVSIEWCLQVASNLIQKRTLEQDANDWGEYVVEEQDLESWSVIGKPRDQDLGLDYDVVSDLFNSEVGRWIHRGKGVSCMPPTSDTSHGFVFSPFYGL